MQDITITLSNNQLESISLLYSGRILSIQDTLTNSTMSDEYTLEKVQELRDLKIEWDHFINVHREARRNARR